jgi:hypothetical protein
MRRNKQSLRSFIAFIVAWAFLILTVTGLVLYVVPQGRVAYWTHWSLASLEKNQWAHLHMMFGGVFIVAGMLHLWFNWKPFRKFLGERVAHHFEPTREVIYSVLAAAIVAILSLLDLPPVSWVFELNDRLKAAWVTSPELEPPFGHAEEVSLAALSRRMDIDLEGAMNELRLEGIVFDSPRDSLETIARANDMTPMQVYAVVRRHHRPERPPGPGELTVERIEARYAGSGIGRKRLAELASAAGVEPDVARERLARAGIEARDGQSTREIADAHGIRPIEVLTIILLPPPVDDPGP